LLRLQSDERLIALTRRGQHAAFEVLCARYQSRLLSFVRHMLGSREDAEDVLQEVFAAAFNAVLGDEREINVRPWLYRIARNRALNHLRRASAVGQDSMDVHFADHGLSTSDRVLRRESFRELLRDVQQLPETQRTALLLREIDALSYEHIADAMETTVPSVKSLLVRARISLAEAAEARKLSCDEVRLELGEAAEGLITVTPPARRHVRDCERCRFFKKQLRQNNHALAAILPVGPLLLVKKLLLAKLGSTASASSAHMAGGAGATMGAGAAVSAGAVGGTSAGGIFTVGAGALGAKAAAGLAAAAIVSAGAVAANQGGTRHHHRLARTSSASVAVRHEAAVPVVIAERPQAATPSFHRAVATSHRRHHHHRAPAPATAVPAPAALAPGAAAPAPATPLPAQAAAPPAPPEPVTQVTSESTQLPASATGAETVSATPAAPPAPTEAAPAASADPATAASPSTATTAAPASAPAAAGTVVPTGPQAALETQPAPAAGGSPVAPAMAPSSTAAPSTPTTAHAPRARTHRRAPAGSRHVRRGAPRAHARHTTAAPRHLHQRHGSVRASGT
jgi:RNA polymerase sigma factor (sigma-70 family)